MVKDDKQELVIEPTPEPVQPFCELIEEEEEDKKDEQRRETPINLTEKEINEKEKKEKEKEKDNEKNEKEKERKEETKKSTSELVREKRKEVASDEGKEVPYHLVPSKKDKERHLMRFLDIFRKLEINMPFGEALQQMPLYCKFQKDMLTRKNKYIHSENIVVEGNCSAVI